MAKIKSTKKGAGKTVKLVGIQIDNDLRGCKLNCVKACS